MVTDALSLWTSQIASNWSTFVPAFTNLTKTTTLRCNSLHLESASLISQQRLKWSRNWHIRTCGKRRGKLDISFNKKLCSGLNLVHNTNNILPETIFRKPHPIRFFIPGKEHTENFFEMKLMEEYWFRNWIWRKPNQTTPVQHSVLPLRLYLEYEWYDVIDHSTSSKKKLNHLTPVFVFPINSNDVVWIVPAVNSFGLLVYSTAARTQMVRIFSVRDILGWLNNGKQQYMEILQAEFSLGAKEGRITLWTFLTYRTTGIISTHPRIATVNTVLHSSLSYI